MCYSLAVLFELK